MEYEDKGEIEIKHADDANVPVNSFLIEPDEGSPKWQWIADNFMPRKGTCGGSYAIEADSREAVLEPVREYVIPLYWAALKNLETVGGNYYWKLKSKR